MFEGSRGGIDVDNLKLDCGYANEVKKQNNLPKIVKKTKFLQRFFAFYFAVWKILRTFAQSCKYKS